MISSEGGYFKILVEGEQVWGDSNGSGFHFFDMIDIYACHPTISPRPSFSLTPSRESLSATLELQTHLRPHEVLHGLLSKYALARSSTMDLLMAIPMSNAQNISLTLHWKDVWSICLPFMVLLITSG